VVEDRLEGGAVQFTIHNCESTMSDSLKFQIPNCKFSTAIAIPIPPPMQSAATP
jgi:hypothetical protein